MKTLRDKLRDSNIKITELSYYLGVSRPTLYNFLDMYINKDYSSLEKKVFDVFKFIDDSKNLTSPILVNYMISKKVSDNVSIIREIDQVEEELRRLKQSELMKDKIKYNFIENVITTNKVDFIIEDLIDFIECSSDYTFEMFIKHSLNKGDK